MQKEELVRAILSNDLSKVEDIIRNKGVDINADIIKGDTPLVVAIQQNNYDVFRKLLELGADVNKTVPKAAYNSNPRNLTPLMVAVTAEDERFVTDLLQKGADVNAQDVEGSTALMIAYASDANIDIEPNMKQIIRSGPNLELEDVNGETVLFYAMRRAADYDSNHWLELLFDAPTPPNVNHKTEFGSAPLHEAIRINYVEAVEYLLNKGADPNIVNYYEFPPMYIAIEDHPGIDAPKIVKLLLDKGARTEFIQEMNGYRWSMLTLAMSEGQTKVAEVLIDVPNIDVNVVDPMDDGTDDTPLMIAIREDYDIGFIQKLIDKGAKVNAVNLNGDTALLESVYGELDQVEIVRMLLDNAANVNMQNDEGKTALMYAAENSLIETVKLLLERGADKTIEDERGKTALDYATDEEIRALLEEKLVGPVEMWKGYTMADAEFFNPILDNESNLANYSICPFCLQYTERSDACKYMTHMCNKNLRNERLYNLYKNSRGYVAWCTVCGRHCIGHNHFPLTDTNETTRPPVMVAKPGADVFRNESCPLEGGGGPDEKIRRIDGLLRYICQMQDEVGKRPTKEVHDELVEEAWKSANLRAQKTVRDIKAAKKFNIPCGLPSVSTMPATVTEAPDVPNPNAEPIRHENAECIVELGVHDDGRPVYEFRHLQPDGTMFNHGDQYICGPDLEELLRNAGGTEDRCPIDSENCKGKLHPDEVKFVLGEESEAYKEYRRRFNEKNKVGGKKRKQSRRKTYRLKKFRGGANGTPILSKMTDVQCSMPEKTKAGTYRRKLNKKKRLTRRGKGRR